MTGKVCACGCGSIIPAAVVAAYPAQRFYSRPCVLRWNRAQEGFEQNRKHGQRRAAAIERVHRWGQPSFDRLRRICDRRGAPLTREQMTAFKIELATVVKLSYIRGWNAARIRYGRQRRGSDPAAPDPPTA